MNLFNGKVNYWMIIIGIIVGLSVLFTSVYLFSLIFKRKRVQTKEFDKTSLSHPKQGGSCKPENYQESSMTTHTIRK